MSSGLPKDAVVLHIGPHKTGTTAIQGALYNARERLVSHGAEYAGPGRQPYLAAHYALRPPGEGGHPTPASRQWKDLCRDAARSAGRRFVISSEVFSGANDDAIPRVIESLGGDRVQVVVTLRPLARILPSQWQQRVQNGMRLRYDEWLHHLFDVPGHQSSAADFWTRHAHGELVRRWAAVAGVDRVTVIVVDDEDRTMLARAFEDLLDLPGGLLVAPTRRTNRSLTATEAELVRRLNRYRKRNGWSRDDYRYFIRRGVTAQLKRRVPDPAEREIETPRWAAERAAAEGAATAEQVRQLGVKVIGDLDHLTRLPSTVTESSSDGSTSQVPLAAAIKGIVGAVTAGLASQAGPGQRPQSADELARPLGNVPTRQLAAILADRVRREARAMARGRFGKSR